MEDKEKLLEFLKSNRLMSLATYSDDLWISTVYYVVDNSFNFYFISNPKTKHGRDIATNKNIACAIADSHQRVKDNKKGVQTQGTASIVNNKIEIVNALILWNKLNPGFEKIINFKNMQKKIMNDKVFKIEPKIIKFFNEELYGQEGYKIFKFGDKK